LVIALANVLAKALALGTYEALPGFVGDKAWAKALAKASTLQKIF
jgi:hypothetical protein